VYRGQPRIFNIELPRYSDKYRPSPASQPTLKKKDLHQPFFPPEIFDGYFNPKKKRRGERHPYNRGVCLITSLIVEKKPPSKRMDIDEMADDPEEQVCVTNHSSPLATKF
jgi:DNA-directed RNA polymerase III subunit RPC7